MNKIRTFRWFLDFITSEIKNLEKIHKERNARKDTRVKQLIQKSNEISICLIGKEVLKIVAVLLKCNSILFI